jgi:hypothetical protein
MAKGVMDFPVYQTVTREGEVIAGPGLDCQRMMIAKTTYEGFVGEGEATVVYVTTLSPHEAQVFEGTRP